MKCVVFYSLVSKWTDDAFYLSSDLNRLRVNVGICQDEFEMMDVRSIFVLYIYAIYAYA